MTTMLIVFYLNLSVNGSSKDFYKFPCLFYVAEALMVVAFFMRCQRIIACCQINDNEQLDKNEFTSKRYLYGEKYYIWVLIITIASFSAKLITI